MWFLRVVVFLVFIVAVLFEKSRLSTSISSYDSTTFFLEPLFVAPALLLIVNSLVSGRVQDMNITVSVYLVHLHCTTQRAQHPVS